MSFGMNMSQGIRGPTGQVGNVIPSGYKAGQIQKFSPEQVNLFKQMFSNVSPESYLSKLAQGDQSLFSQMEEPALKQFSGLQGNIASRFSGMGSGARKSSGFQNTMNSAASNFAEQLQSNRQSLQQQAIKDLMSMSSDLLGQQPYESFLAEKPQRRRSGWGSFFGNLAGAIPGAIAGAFTGGPAGGITGAASGLSGASGRSFGRMF